MEPFLPVGKGEEPLHLQVVCEEGAAKAHGVPEVSEEDRREGEGLTVDVRVEDMGQHEAASTKLHAVEEGEGVPAQPLLPGCLLDREAQVGVGLGVAVSGEVLENRKDSGVPKTLQPILQGLADLFGGIPEGPPVDKILWVCGDVADRGEVDVDSRLRQPLGQGGGGLLSLFSGQGGELPTPWEGREALPNSVDHPHLLVDAEEKGTRHAALQLGDELPKVAVVEDVLAKEDDSAVGDRVEHLRDRFGVGSLKASDDLPVEEFLGEPHRFLFLALGAGLFVSFSWAEPESSFSPLRPLTGKNLSSASEGTR